MIGTILTKKLVTSLAYTLIGSEVVRKNLTVDNARRVATAIGKAATTAGSTIINKAGSLKEAVNDRKRELLASRHEVLTAKDELTTKAEMLVARDDLATRDNDEDEDSLI